MELDDLGIAIDAMEDVECQKLGLQPQALTYAEAANYVNPTNPLLVLEEFRILEDNRRH